MGNSSSSLRTQYMELVKGLLHSIGIRVSTRQLSELFRLVEQYCHWFQYQTKLQLNLKEWKMIQKELRKQHWKGNVIPLKLRTLCNAITQALTLLSTDNETKSNASVKGEAIYEDVSNVGGVSALAEGKDTSKPPSENGETSVSSESDLEASSVSSEKGKEIKEITHLFQEWWKSHKEEKKSTSSAPPCACLFPTAVDRPDVGREYCRFSFPLSMLPDDDLPAPPSGFIDPPQLFPIQRQQDDNVINVQYTPLEYKFFKNLKVAVVQYGPQSPFVLAMLESLGKGKLIIPLDWESIALAVLEGSQWLQLHSWWGKKKKKAKKQAQINTRQNPPVLSRTN